MSTLLIFFIYAVIALNYGFAQIKLGHGATGIPLIYVIAGAAFVYSTAGGMIDKVYLRTGIGKFHLCWAVYIVARVGYGAIHEPYWAVRDASYLIDSVWILAGFNIGSKSSSEPLIFLGLKWLALALLLVSVAYLNREQLINVVPILQGAQGQPIPLFLTIGNTGFMLIVLMFFFWNEPIRPNAWVWSTVFTAIALGVVLIICPSRSNLIQLGVCSAATAAGLFGRRNRWPGKLTVFLLILFANVLIFEILDLSARGRFAGKEYSLDQLGQLVSEINPFYQTSVQLTSGWGDRFQWWTDLWSEIGSSPSNIVFGLGYGVPLIDFVADKTASSFAGVLEGGVAVREPHNDILAMWGRGGVVGLLLFILFQGAVWRRIMTAARNGFGSEPLRALCGLYAMGLMIHMMGEPMISQPYFMTPFFFFEGLVLGNSLVRQEGGDSIAQGGEEAIDAGTTQAV
jgi:O-antigen ligase